MKKLFILSSLAIAMMLSFSSCNKENGDDSIEFPCFVSASDLSAAMPDVVELKLADKSYYTRCAFVPFDGKKKLTYDSTCSSYFKYTLDPTGSIYWAAFSAEEFGLAGWAFGFAASNASKVGDETTATLTYDDGKGVKFQKVVKLKVVE